MIAPRVVFLSGPTGVGKSDLAIKLAQCLSGEIISCDSVQIYRGLDIGSNKTTQTYGIPHHLINCVDWWEEFNASCFYQRCTALVDEIAARGKVPILVGGTGMYMNWVLDGKPSSKPTSSQTMEKVKLWLQEDSSWEVSLARLQKLDPDYASRLLKNDYYRLARALTINLDNGKPLAAFKPSKPSNLFEHHLGWNVLCLYLSTDRRYLYRLIDWRCEKMIEAGLLREIAQLKRKGFSSQFIAAKSIGYQEGLEFLDSLKREEEKHVFSICKDKFMRNFLGFLVKFQSESRKYARKQDTWFAKDPRFYWLPRNTPTTQAVCFPEEQEFKFGNDKEYQNLDSLARWISTASLQQLEERSLCAKSHKRSQKEMKTYQTIQRIYTSDSAIESVYFELEKEANEC